MLYLRIIFFIMTATNCFNLSVLVPAYNEGKTIKQLLRKVSQVELVENMGMEIVLVNDCSTDNTLTEVAQFMTENPEVKLVLHSHAKNQGKGAAIRSAIALSTGNIIIIQDADLEYEPADYNLLLPYIISGEYKVVYGSRFLNRQNKHSYRSFYLGGRLVSIVANILFGQHLTDEPTCYKMFEADVLKNINLKCTGFEFCPEVTAKVIKAKNKIKEIPIHYYPRSVEDGKKIKWYDGLEAIWTLLKYRFID